jgi:hypothetical protein
MKSTLNLLTLGARVSRVIGIYSGTRDTRAPASLGKINLAEAGIFRLSLI